MKMILTALVTLGLAGVAVPAAHASTVTYGADGALVVTAAPGETNRIGIQSDPSDTTRVRVYEGKPDLTVTAPATCAAIGVDLVSCPLPAAGVRVDLGDGDDDGYISSDLPNVPMAISGGAGNDDLRASLDGQPTTLDGGPGADKLQGGPGTDTLIGGDGNDDLDGWSGSDRLDGGAGDDVLSGDANRQPSPDVIDGGPGYDRIDWTRSSYTEANTYNVTLGAGADDGLPGEGDDVRNVEKVQTYGPSTLVGTDADEYLEVVQVTSPSTIRGGGGNDTLRASDGPDTIDGGAGDDNIDAGFGDDTITGGPGRDSIAGDRRGGDCGPIWCKLPFGNDTIDARDGEQDSVSCGFGDDTVYADAVDVVAPDCEHVTRGAAPAPGPNTTPGATKALAVSASKVKLARALAHGLKLRVTVPSAGKLTATAKGASGSSKVKKAGPATVVLRFTKAAKRSLRRKRSVKLLVTVRFGALDGSLKVTLER
ncbi:calcium-binding protein [Candidatus Solirubrobacter pratensis]|uniref:calcium-binding protein n=1 Tax=Candidatus Solirubrobacter pratensis TaxID=1298857 RepID=UPI0003FA9749|nr:calcium-binding protein [Candidatus Solirubrobacter pratensis]